MSAAAGGGGAAVYRVVIAGNLVCAIERVAASAAPVPATPLDAATGLAQTFQATGTIDGHYHFESLERARVFAQLCLDFTAKLVERRSAELERHPAGEDYRAGPEPAGRH
ncbi:MAG: hypothetical protein ACOZDY_07085 [Pseudomonadota bacterium]